MAGMSGCPLPPAHLDSLPSGHRIPGRSQNFSSCKKANHQMTDPRYGLASWKRRRAEQLRREPLCRMCSALGLTVLATVADHVQKHGGNDRAFWEGETQSLCASCHSSHKQRAEKSGRVVGNAKDGSPLDPGHHWNRGE